MKIPTEGMSFDAHRDEGGNRCVFLGPNAFGNLEWVRELFLEKPKTCDNCQYWIMRPEKTHGLCGGVILGDVGSVTVFEDETHTQKIKSWCFSTAAKFGCVRYKPK